MAVPRVTAMRSRDVPTCWAPEVGGLVSGQSQAAWVQIQGVTIDKAFPPWPQVSLLGVQSEGFLVVAAGVTGAGDLPRAPKALV